MTDGDQPPTRIARGKLIPGTRYRVERWLGEGGMGVVYEATHVDIEQRVALKVLRRRYCADAAAVRLFRQEARATGQLGSENIVQVRDFAELPDGRLLIAMEFLEGQDLQGILDRPLELGRAIAILRQCCRGLAIAHDHGLIHRDVKPENIFLTAERGRPDKATLLDFGISMFVDGEAADGLVGGTPGFLPPEAVLHGVVGPAVDQYALGCVAYAMLTGRRAFVGDTMTEVISATLEGPPSPPSLFNDRVPPALESVVMRCLAMDPGMRFAGMRDVEAALCRAQIEAGLETGWDDLPLPDVEPEDRAWLLDHMPEPETGMLRSRHRRRMSIALAAGLGLAVATVVVTVSSVPSQTASARAPDFLQQRADAARGAAAKALFVYPLPEDPSSPTAYGIVRELEATVGPARHAALARAADLRAEFAETLTRLGDSYWTADAGRSFAIGYYEQAALFVPGAEPATSRSQLSAVRLEWLGTRAAAGDFHPLELEMAQPLVVLATDDPNARREQLRAFRVRRKARAAAFDAQLDALTAAPAADPTSPPQGRVEKAPQARAAPPPSPALESAVEEASTEQRRRSKQQAAHAARSGAAALRAGSDDRARVLFDTALGLDPSNVTAVAGLRDLYFDRGDHGRALRYAKRVVRIAPRSGRHQLRLGDAYFKTARYELAAKHYREAVRRGTAGARSRLHRAEERLPSSGP